MFYKHFIDFIKYLLLCPFTFRFICIIILVHTFAGDLVSACVTFLGRNIHYIYHNLSLNTISLNIKSCLSIVTIGFFD